MKFKVIDNWGMMEIVFEDGSKAQPKGQMVSYKGVVGRIWSILDVSSHCGGHGMGQMRSSQAIVVTKNMEIVPVKTVWEDVYDLDMLGAYPQ